MNLDNVNSFKELYLVLKKCETEFPDIVKDVQDFIGLEEQKINLIINHKTVISPVLKSKIKKFLTFYAKGVPFEYITNFSNFYGLNLYVDDNVLIPRPETELIVDAVRSIVSKGFCKIADIGTGSGCIAIALSIFLPNAKVIAIDNSSSAIEVAMKNIQNYKALNVTAVMSSFMDTFLENSLDVIVSNPPYIDPLDPHLDSLSFEPLTALASHDKGFHHIKTIFLQSKQTLKKGGFLIIEHGYNQALEVNRLSQKHGFQLVKNIKDYQGIDRIHVCKK